MKIYLIGECVNKIFLDGLLIRGEFKVKGWILGRHIDLAVIDIQMEIEIEKGKEYFLLLKVNQINDGKVYGEIQDRSLREIIF